MWSIWNESYKKVATREGRLQKVTLQTCCLLHSFFIFKTSHCKSTQNNRDTSWRTGGNGSSRWVRRAETYFLANPASSALSLLSFRKCASVQHKEKLIVCVCECWVLREELLLEITNGHRIWIFKACTGTRIPGHRFIPAAQMSLSVTAWRRLSAVTAGQEAAAAVLGGRTPKLSIQCLLSTCPRRGHFCFLPSLSNGSSAQ